ncbi:hypothetical protein [Pseudomonas sp. MF6776]|uniref:hypothetical protein n=1 Tax=Pseudomonas sp. MF6776 TaxID=2797534 RepID=UPI00190D8907|nr:hypothetical protein [Pseudomonas sp. MF6776]MBK3467119.1 hypothetical protein [Pseudomonas sp. MF6776]
MGVLATLAGCGAYNEFQANNAVEEYRMACMGNYTNECESKLVDTNIIMLELARSNVDREKDTLITAVGKANYERFASTANEVIDGLIEQQESKRPGFFARFFLGEAQPFGDTRNQLFNISDMQELRSVVLEKIRAQVRAESTASMSPAAAVPLVKEVAPAAPQTPVPSASAAPAATTDEVPVAALDGAVDRMIAEELAKDGGDEFKEGRKVVFEDLNDDGVKDAIVLYTIEGQGGSNSYFQSLATFYADNKGWNYRGAIVVGSGVQNVQVVDSKKLALKVLSVGPEDANCCPSVESTEQYKWDGSTFIQLPSA